MADRHCLSHRSRLAKVTSRTLRHYDDIGLLPPAYADDSGGRFYRRHDLARVQQILLLRELGLDLDRIAATVARTIRGLEGGAKMQVERMFEGFAPGSAKAEALAREAAERWGEQATASHECSENWRRQKWDAVNRQGATAKLAELAKAGVPVKDERVLGAVAAHYEWIKNHWTPDSESYAGLGRLYADDERFRGQYEAVHPGFADYLRDALAAFAAARLND